MAQKFVGQDQVLKTRRDPVRDVVMVKLRSPTGKTRWEAMPGTEYARRSIIR